MIGNLLYKIHKICDDQGSANKLTHRVVKANRTENANSMNKYIDCSRRLDVYGMNKYINRTRRLKINN